LGLVAIFVVGVPALFAGDAEARAPGRKGPGCIYGQVVDGHSGEVRCLSPAEVSPRAPYDTPDSPDAGADAAPEASAPLRRDGGGVVDASAPIPLRPFSATVEGLSFENGEVPRAAAALERIKKDFSKCASAESTPGRSDGVKPDGSIELRFLVRAPGKAEGVDVVQSRGVSADVVKCVATSLAGRSVGAPTNEPVAVSLVVRFKKD
jgi:hypothetical protein